jgi:hypothetical protein
VVLLVFFFILPVINGFWDWLSWWVTRLLGRHLLVTLAPARALGGRAVTILGHGLLDFVLSAALLAAMAFLLAFGFEAYDQIAAAQGQHAFDLGPYLEAAADHPWTDGLWLTVMLLSTLFPTALHVVVLLASPLALITLPTERRLQLAGELETWDEQPERHASIQRRAGQYVARERHGAIAIAAGLFVLLTGGLLALINFGLGMLEPGQSVAHLVLGIAEAGRATADALAATLGI